MENPEISKSFFHFDENVRAIAVIDLSLDANNTYAPSDVSLCDRPTYWIARVSVPSVMRRQGVGTFLMKKMCEWLDEGRFHAVIGVSSYGEMSNEDLQSFYERFGFVFDKNKIGCRLAK